MLPLLRTVEAIVSCRDRAGLPGTLLHAVSTFLGDTAGAAVFVRDGQGEVLLNGACGRPFPSLENSALFALINQVDGPGVHVESSLAGRRCAALMLQASEVSDAQEVLVYDVKPSDPHACAEKIACLARIYGSQVKLLDYSELDTLTRLLNRKTFDETFDRLLAASLEEVVDGLTSERRQLVADAVPAWLCVIDIDHFKRINDSFGHLFGDEVLLRMGDLMRKTFRTGDRLFRFGGEEFVVMLNAEDEAQAAKCFERFRISVEQHEFPQVGQVTCSIGFTAVSSRDVPTDVVGRADKALYFAKEHGRNRICGYEALLAEGAIAPPLRSEAGVAENFDIDALFS